MEELNWRTTIECTPIDFEGGIDWEYKFFCANYMPYLFYWNCGLFDEEFENIIQQMYAEKKGWA